MSLVIKKQIQYALLSWLRGARTQRIRESCQERKCLCGKALLISNRQGLPDESLRSQESRMVGESKVFLSLWFPQLDNNLWEAQRAWTKERCKTWPTLASCGELGQVRAIVWTHGWPSFQAVNSEVTKTADDNVSKHAELTPEGETTKPRKSGRPVFYGVGIFKFILKPWSHFPF